MKKYLYLLTISISLISCYTYKLREGKDAKPEAKEAISKADAEIAQKEIANAQPSPSPMVGKSTRIAGVSRTASSNRTASNNGISSSNRTSSNNRVTSKSQVSKPMSITEKLEPGKFFKIDVADRSYKIQVDKWESDTLVAHVIHKPKKILKFHRNQINQSTIAERRFSQPVADILTVAVYAGIGVGIWALVQ